LRRPVLSLERIQRCGMSVRLPTFYSCLHDFVGNVLTTWSTSRAARMDGMFYKTGDFNSKLTHFDLSNVAYTDFMVGHVPSFAVGKVMSMASMFLAAVC
jgi:hypothetical protein